MTPRCRNDAWEIYKGTTKTVTKPEMQVSDEKMRAERVPLAYRDYCAHLLIPLNKCRQKNYYMPFRCTDERHAYEKCQYEDYVRRVDEMAKKVREQRQKDMENRDIKEKQARIAEYEAQQNK